MHKYRHVLLISKRSGKKVARNAGGSTLAKAPLFTAGPASDIGYVNLRDAKDGLMRAAREDCEALWETFEPYADEHFLSEIRSNFDVRYWEMYLTASLIQDGYPVSCPKPGPDVGIVYNGKRIWFEATSPTRGAEGAADQVPKLRPLTLGEEPVMQDVPNEKLVLRYLNSISGKCKAQLPSWTEKNIIGPNDALVIAINPRRLGHEFGDADPPRILQAAFAIGSPYAAIDPKTGETIETGYQFRDTITKASGSTVSTGVFLQDEYSGLSGLLCSRVDVVNQPAQIGSDFQLVPNPRATVPLPDRFHLKGTYFRIEAAEDGYVAIPEMH
jgi:hypothetical protein